MRNQGPNFTSLSYAVYVDQDRKKYNAYEIESRAKQHQFQTPLRLHHTIFLRIHFVDLCSFLTTMCVTGLLRFWRSRPRTRVVHALLENFAPSKLPFPGFVITSGLGLVPTGRSCSSCSASRHQTSIPSRQRLAFAILGFSDYRALASRWIK
jgi:hypothetical protein